MSPDPLVDDPLGTGSGGVALGRLNWTLHGTESGAIGWTGPWEQAEAPVLRAGGVSILRPRLEELSQLSLPASVPGTLAAALRDAGREPVAQPDDRDWWWRADLELPSGEPQGQWELSLRGVATVSEVWWDGPATPSGARPGRPARSPMSRRAGLEDDGAPASWRISRCAGAGRR